MKIVLFKDGGEPMSRTLPPIRERRVVRVLRIVGFFTIEDIRWMMRVEHDCPELNFKPEDYFRNLEISIVRALEGERISLEEEQNLKAFIRGDQHWTELFREEIMPNYPVIRAANKVISGRLTGKEMYYQWDPDRFFEDLKYHAPLFKVWRHYTIPFRMESDYAPLNHEEEELLRFYGKADLDYVFRVPPMPNLLTNFPLTKSEMLDEIFYSPNNMSYDTLCLLTAMFKNDVVIWRITELELGKLIPASNLVWAWGKRVYESEKLMRITEKLLSQMDNLHVTQKS